MRVIIFKYFPYFNYISIQTMKNLQKLSPVLQYPNYVPFFINVIMIDAILLFQTNILPLHIIYIYTIPKIIFVIFYISIYKYNK